MFASTRRRFAATFMSIALLCAASGEVANAAARSFEDLIAATPVVQAVGPTLPATLPVVDRACTGGQELECYEPAAAAQFVNVSTFFDKARRSSSRHFFVKLFTPPAADATYRIVGMSFVTNRAIDSRRPASC
jgi:hypothetical protein